MKNVLTVKLKGVDGSGDAEFEVDINLKHVSTITKIKRHEGEISEHRIALISGDYYYVSEEEARKIREYLNK